MQASGKGGSQGQWSARKAQLLAQEYERRGGGYRGEKTDAQRHLEEWTAQEWQSVSGSGHADRGSMHRYLPAKAWAMLPEQDQVEAERSKIREDERGNQYAEWPEIVRDAMLAMGAIEGDADSVTNDRLRTSLRSWA